MQPGNFPDVLILETERLLLRALTPELYAYLFDHCDDNEIKSFLGLENKAALDEEKKKFKDGLTTYRLSFKYFQIINKENSAITGSCGFHSWFFQHQRAEIGYAMSDEVCKGKGIMSEAMEPIIEYGFNSMQLNRIEACVAPGNEPSLKLMKKFGFKEEGYLREHYKKDGIIEDSIIFSLLRKEYQGQRSSLNNSLY